jgi:hypothetical protein
VVRNAVNESPCWLFDSWLSDTGFIDLHLFAFFDEILSNAGIVGYR